MKYILFILSFFCFNLIHAGNLIESSRGNVDSILCDSLSKQKADILARQIIEKDYSAAGMTIDEWKQLCPNSEIIARSEIIYNLIADRNVDQLIENYFGDDLHFVYKNRMENVAADEYQYISRDYRTYYNYVPLRHQLDSALMLAAKELLIKKKLNNDEKLICILFSGEVNSFEKENKKSNYRGSFIQEFSNNDRRYFSRENFSGHFYVGSYTPFNESKGFGTNPYFGISFASPLKYKIQGEIYMKFRLNINDENFDYYALGIINDVNSKLGFSIGLAGGYKIFENENLIIIPKIALGYESISTGLREYDEESEETFFHNVETLHSSIGLSVLKPIFRRNYIGMEVNYHYCPYGFDDDLISKFDNSAYSFEIFFRF